MKNPHWTIWREHAEPRSVEEYRRFFYFKGEYRLVAVGTYGFNYYMVMSGFWKGHFLSIPWPGNCVMNGGCCPSIFGDRDYFMKHLDQRPDLCRLTPYGAWLMSSL